METRREISVRFPHGHKSNDDEARLRSTELSKLYRVNITKKQNLGDLFCEFCINLREKGETRILSAYTWDDEDAIYVEVELDFNEDFKDLLEETCLANCQFKEQTHGTFGSTFVQKQQNSALYPGKLVKICCRPYMGRLGQIMESNLNGLDFLVRFLPSIDYERLTNKRFESQNALTKMMRKEDPNYEPPEAKFFSSDIQRLGNLLNHTIVKKIPKKINSVSLEFEKWDDCEFRKYFQYRRFRIQDLDLTQKIEAKEYAPFAEDHDPQLQRIMDYEKITEMQKPGKNKSTIIQIKPEKTKEEPLILKPQKTNIPYKAWVPIMGETYDFRSIIGEYRGQDNYEKTQNFLVPEETTKDIQVKNVSVMLTKQYFDFEAMHILRIGSTNEAHLVSESEDSDFYVEAPQLLFRLYDLVEVKGQGPAVVSNINEESTKFEVTFLDNRTMEISEDDVEKNNIDGPRFYLSETTKGKDGSVICVRDTVQTDDDVGRAVAIFKGSVFIRFDEKRASWYPGEKISAVDDVGRDAGNIIGKAILYKNKKYKIVNFNNNEEDPLIIAEDFKKDLINIKFTDYRSKWIFCV